MFLILLVIILTIPIKVLYTFYTLGAIAEIGHCNVREADFEAELLWRAQKEFREQVYVFIQQIWTIYFWLIWIHTMWLHHLNSSVSDGSLVRLGATLRARWLSKWSLGWHEICLFGSICTQTWLDATTAVRQWDLSINQPHPINSCCWKPTIFWTICRSADFSWTKLEEFYRLGLNHGRPIKSEICGVKSRNTIRSANGSCVLNWLLVPCRMMDGSDERAWRSWWHLLGFSTHFYSSGFFQCLMFACASHSHGTLIVLGMVAEFKCVVRGHVVGSHILDALTAQVADGWFLTKQDAAWNHHIAGMDVTPHALRLPWGSANHIFMQSMMACEGIKSSLSEFGHVWFMFSGMFSLQKIGEKKNCSMVDVS